MARQPNVPRFDKADVLDRLGRAWSALSSPKWQASNPARGQGAVTALVIHQIYGAEILKTPVNGQEHFYNSFGGERIDFTECQFDGPVDYLDHPSSRDEALFYVTAEEYEHLLVAFQTL